MTSQDDARRLTPLPDGGARITIDLTDKAYELVVILEETGLFGHDVYDVMERLVCRSLIDLTENGWTPMPGKKKKRR